MSKNKIKDESLDFGIQMTPKKFNFGLINFFQLTLNFCDGVQSTLIRNKIDKA